jgi:hypothetical protein
MRYLDIKIVEETRAIIDYAEGDLFEVIIKIDTQEDLFKIPKVPFSLFSSSDPAVVFDIFKRYIKNNASDVAESFKIVTIQVIDPDGVEMPLQNLFPSIDGDEDIAKDYFNSVVTVNLNDSRIYEYKQWLADDTQTTFQQDNRAPTFTKDRLKELTIIEEGPMQGALVDPTLGTAVGAIAGTPAESKLNDYMNNAAGMPKMVGIVGIPGSSQDGAEGSSGIMTDEEQAEVPSIVEQLFSSIDGFGTNETKMIAALSRITSPAQLNEIIKSYRKEYDRNLAGDIRAEFEFQGGNTTSVIAELNDVMMPLGWELTGTPFTSLQWKRYEGRWK